MSKLINEEYMDNLCELIEKDKVNEFKHKKWIEKCLIELICYKENEKEKPKELIEMLYNKFKKIFPYNGICYRGIGTNDNIVLKNELVSFSKDGTTAIGFTDGNFMNKAIIAQDVKDGFDLSGFMKCIFSNMEFTKKSIKTKIDIFIAEEEIIAYLEKDIADIEYFN